MTDIIHIELSYTESQDNPDGKGAISTMCCGQVLFYKEDGFLSPPGHDFIGQNGAVQPPSTIEQVTCETCKGWKKPAIKKQRSRRPPARIDGCIVLTE